MELFRPKKETKDWVTMISAIQQRNFESHVGCGESRPATMACLSRLCQVSDRIQTSQRSSKALILRHLDRIASEHKLNMVVMGQQVHLRGDCFSVILLVHPETGNVEAVNFDMSSLKQSCPELTSDLQHGRFDTLVSHIEEISAVYNIPGQNPVRQKAWLCLQSLEEDLFKLSRVLLTTLDSSNVADPMKLPLVDRVNSSCIGLVKRRVGGLSSRLLYSVMNKSKTQTEKDIWSKSNNWSARVSLEASQQENLLPFVPLVTVHNLPDKKNKVKFAHIDNVKCVSLYAEFVLILESPVVIEKNLLKELEIISKTNLLPDQPAENLMTLILNQSGEYIVPDSPIYQNVPTGQQAYHVTCSLQGYVIKKVSFSDTREVVNVVAILRKMVAFNSFLNSFMKYHANIQKLNEEAMVHYQVDIPSLDYLTVSLDHSVNNIWGKSLRVMVNASGAHDCVIQPAVKYEQSVRSSLQETQSLPLVLALMEVLDLKSSGFPVNMSDKIGPASSAGIKSGSSTKKNLSVGPTTVNSAIQRVKKLSDHTVIIQDPISIIGDGPPAYKLEPVVIPSRPTPLSLPIPQPLPLAPPPPQSPIPSLPPVGNKIPTNHSFPTASLNNPPVPVPTIPGTLVANSGVPSVRSGPPLGFSGLSQPMSDIRLDDLLRSDGPPFTLAPNNVTPSGLSHCHSQARPGRTDEDYVLISLLNDESSILQQQATNTVLNFPPHKMESQHPYSLNNPIPGQPSPNKPPQTLTSAATSQPNLTSPIAVPSAPAAKNPLYFGQGPGVARCQLPGVMATSAPKQMLSGGGAKSRMGLHAQQPTKKQRKRHGDGEVSAAPNKKHKPPAPISMLASNLESSLDADGPGLMSSVSSTGFEFTGNCGGKPDERSSTPTPAHNLSFSSSSSGGQLSRQSSIESRYANSTPRSVTNIYDFSDDMPATSMTTASATSADKSLRMTIKASGSSLHTVKMSSDKTASSPLKKIKSQPISSGDYYNKSGGGSLPSGGISLSVTKATAAPKSVSNIMMQNSLYSGPTGTNYPPVNNNNNSSDSSSQPMPNSSSGDQPKKRKRRTKEEMQRDKQLGLDSKKKKKELSSSIGQQNFPQLPGVNSALGQQLFNPNATSNAPTAAIPTEKASSQQLSLSARPNTAKVGKAVRPASGMGLPKSNSVSSVAKQKLKEKSKKNVAAAAAAESLQKAASASSFPTGSTPFGGILGENLVTNYRIPKKTPSNPSSDISSPSVPPGSNSAAPMSTNLSANTTSKSSFSDNSSLFNSNKSAANSHQTSLLPQTTASMTTSSSNYRENANSTTGSKEKSSVTTSSGGGDSSNGNNQVSPFDSDSRPTFGTLPLMFQQNRTQMSRPPTAIQPNRSKSGVLSDPVEANNGSSIPVQPRPIGNTFGSRPTSSINAIADKLMVARSSSQSEFNKDGTSMRRLDGDQSASGPVDNIFEKLTTSSNDKRTNIRSMPPGPAPIISTKETPDSPTEQPVSSTGPNVQNIPVSPPATSQNIPDTKLCHSDNSWPRFGRPIYGSSIQFTSSNNGKSTEKH